MSAGNLKGRRSIFDWFTVAAAWCGVIIAVWTSVQQYRQSSLKSDLSYGHYGANYSVKSGDDSLIHWRMMISNQGDLAAKDVRIKLWDVPERADIWSSLGYSVESRDSSTALIKLDLIPPRANAFVVVLPFERRRQRLMPYAEKIYYESGFARRQSWLDDNAKIQIFEVLAKLEGYEGGVCGLDRTWDTPVTDDDIEWGSHYFTIEDR